jgi:type IV secretory pathway VirJ component
MQRAAATQDGKLGRAAAALPPAALLRTLLLRAVLLLAALLPCPRAPAAPAPASAPTPALSFDFGDFGNISIYRDGTAPRDVVLFLSGEGGWDAGVISMAKTLTGRGAVVAGVDIRHYLQQLDKSPEKCASPATDLENLSRYLQEKLAFTQYIEPTLVGYSSGATLVYAALAEAPDGSFKGALSIGVRRDLGLEKPLCKGLGAKPAGRWIAVEKNWLPRFEAAYEQVTASPGRGATPALPASVADLPLTVVPALPGSPSPWFGIFLSGDGGWVGLDRGVSRELAKHHIPIVGWDSLKYFWSPRTPQGTAQDLDRVVRHYAQEWGRSHVLLIGFSQGADTMPFMVNRLPARTHDMIGLTALLGISDNALFEFHLQNWLGTPSRGIPTAPELQHWSGAPYLCLYGEGDGDAACAEVTGKEGVAVKMAGGHHFGGGYAEIAAQILSRLPKL